MQDPASRIEDLGNIEPILADSRRQAPDRREISARWLSGTVLTGLTSTLLMGVALSAALDGRQQLATPPEIIASAEMERSQDNQENAKSSRLAIAQPAPKIRDRRRMDVSTVVKAGDRDLIRMVPFVEVTMALAAGHKTDRSYPRFNPLEVFGERRIASGESQFPGTIYGAKVESEVFLRTIDFPLQTTSFDERSGLSTSDVEEVVRKTGAILTDGAVQVAALHYVDPTRFGNEYPGLSVPLPRNVRIVQENVSVAPVSTQASPTNYAEDVIIFRDTANIRKTLARQGYEGTDAEGMAEAIGTLMQADTLKANTIVRLGVETRNEQAGIVRASVYHRNEHVLTIARDDRGQYVPSDEPGGNFQAVAYLENTPAPVRTKTDLPTTYDGIFRAAYSYGLTEEMTRELIRLLAADVDYQARLNPSDKLSVFFSNPDENNQATEKSQMLYVQASFNGNTRAFFRWQDKKGNVDYFDEDGRSARQFLLRNPVPNGKFRSGFGGRRHPILGYVKMHTGVDWSAPTGTPIISSGNGVIEKAGWAGGYGRQTIIRHANGYETSYNHQSAFAKGIKKGARVRQGQIIGYIGTSGLSTGPHLHYELIVNGRKVDPMRVRLPTGKVLKGDELAAFKVERTRIEALLQSANEEFEVASQ